MKKILNGEKRQVKLMKFSFSIFRLELLMDGCS
jgi:hypothetical protein